MPTPGAGGVGVYFRIDPGDLAWMDAFVGELPAKLEVANALLLTGGLATMRRFMHERFQRISYRPGSLYTSVRGARLHSLLTPGFQIAVGADVAYALQREFGGEIATRTKPFLVFQTYDGKWHRVRRVPTGRPGSRPQPAAAYFRETVAQLVVAAPAAYADAVRRALEAAISLRGRRPPHGQAPAGAFAPPAAAVPRPLQGPSLPGAGGRAAP